MMHVLVFNLNVFKQNMCTLYAQIIDETKANRLGQEGQGGIRLDIGCRGVPDGHGGVSH